MFGWGRWSVRRSGGFGRVSGQREYGEGELRLKLESEYKF